MPDVSDLAAYRRIQEDLYARGVIETPLLPLALSHSTAAANIFLKLENLQPVVRCYKLRGAIQALLARPGCDGVITASAGNFAQALALACAKLDIPVTILVPSSIPPVKLSRIETINPKARIVAISASEWWRCMVDASGEHLKESCDIRQLTFISPATDTHVIDGNASIGMELGAAAALRGVRDVHVYVPYGGGGLLRGIARSLQAICRERSDFHVKFFACEVDTGAPLHASLRAGSPQTVEHSPSWIDGIGAPSVLAESFTAVKRLGCSSLVVSTEAVARACSFLLNQQGMLVEGAGAVSLAAAWQHARPGAHSVCIVSGGNVDAKTWRSWPR